jgi:hypothetical protein
MATAARKKTTQTNARPKKATGKPKKPAAAPSSAPALLPPSATREPVQPEVAKSPKPKQKVVRDGFTMPREDFALIGTLKERMVAFRRPTRKSELLRAGLHVLMALPDARLASALDGLAPLKAGRPKKPA